MEAVPVRAPRKSREGVVVERQRRVGRAARSVGERPWRLLRPTEGLEYRGTIRNGGRCCKMRDELRRGLSREREYLGLRREIVHTVRTRSCGGCLSVPPASRGGADPVKQGAPLGMAGAAGRAELVV